MRISVCEFLRIMTSENWFFLSPGVWMKDGGDEMAYRQDHFHDEIHIYKNDVVAHVPVRKLKYFAGKPSHVVRKRNIKKGKKK